MNTRIYISKKPEFQVESRSLTDTLKTDLHLADDFKAAVYNIYDIFNAEQSDLDLLCSSVIAETMTDSVIEEVEVPEGAAVLAYEYLPGQYDQRADSAMQCLMLLNNKNDVRIHSGTLLVLENASDKELEAIADYMINPVEARRKDLSVLNDDLNIDIKPVPVLEGFREESESDLQKRLNSMGLAMSLADLKLVQDYFKEEGRDPNETEIRVLDTYWSDHCRHTTFETELVNVTFEPGIFQKEMEKQWNTYLQARKDLGREAKPVTLMDLATVAGRIMRKDGRLADEEVSEEINACSVHVTVDVDGKDEDWLLMFKNETHNHPTEIEPFGGASTCIGGAIRDPLSGRSYVYQAMRITGAGDITAPVSETLENKLPQSKISKTAAKGYSSYGNQIGLATTFVEEVFDPGYTAKRMEVGAVAGAAPAANVIRKTPAKGDLIVLIGGATGRDGIGGATGSSKAHTEKSLSECSSEVQKGNALIERKLQRLFRNPDATRLIKKANDFGAGGVSVAIGELADGLDINLDAVPVKYEGLNATELAISESQERMAVCIDPKDLEAFAKECEKENLNAIVVAEVTDTNRLIMRCKGNTVLDLSRDFLNTNGARQTVDVLVKEPEEKAEPAKSEDILEILQQPNVAGQIGLAEMFDASIGKSTVLMPFGGKTQHTPEQGSVQKFPVDGFTNTASLMTYGFDPEISKASPWLGAQYSVVEALAKLAALGADSSKARLTNQEYFERLNFDPEKWGYPLQALLGLFKAQMEFGTPAIGGKDSMSGTFKDIHVPPTLITFAVATAKTDKITSSAFKEAGNPVYLIKHTPKEDGAPNYEQLKANFASLKEQIDAGNVKASRALKSAGVIEAAALMSFGNEIGAVLNTKNPADSAIGSILVEASAPVEAENWIQIGNTSEDKTLSINGQEVSIDDAFAAWNKRYDELYPRLSKAENKDIPQTKLHERSERRVSKVKVDKPVVVLPVFPGQNCEFDTKIQFERAGAEVHTIVFNNLDVENIEKSIDTLAAEIEKAQIFMLVGGFSLGDEPDGSGKFIVNVLKNKKIAKALETMRANEGLILGICNGFQALIKSGLLPYGTSLTDQESATLFHNDINRHISHIGHTRITSNLSPWLQDFNAGDIFEVALSHGEGKLMATSQMLEEWNANGQIACQYVDENGNPTMDPKWNLNGSQYAIEALTSKDGMVLGKMGHSERYEPGLMQNISGNLNQHIFENGVRFFTHK